MPTPEPAPRSARARARAEITQEILETARRHLAAEGATGLSLRAVARDLGMVSSAVYRYIPSRDDLLTALIVAAYDAMGEAAERSESACRRADLEGRFLAVARSVRSWALAHPHEYALLYGSPVPGYAAPQDTIAPATRVPALLVGVLVDAAGAGQRPAGPATPVPRAVHRDLAQLKAELRAPGLSDDLLVRGLMAWTHLFGAVSFELFGHRTNVVTDHDAFFEHEMRRVAGWVLPAG